jgi:hypothetical protein
MRDPFAITLQSSRDFFRCGNVAGPESWLSGFFWLFEEKPVYLPTNQGFKSFWLSGSGVGRYRPDAALESLRHAREIQGRKGLPPPLVPSGEELIDCGGLWRIVAALSPPPFLFVGKGFMLLWRNFQGYPN